MESLLWRCRGEQDWNNQNGYKAAALCVCITGDLHTVFVRVTNEMRRETNHALYFILCLKNNIQTTFTSENMLIYLESFKTVCVLKERVFKTKAKYIYRVCETD